VKKEDLKITFHKGILTISGEQKQEKEEKNETTHIQERLYGSFKRMIRLPDSADERKVSAELKDGVLCVKIEKKEKSKPVEIPIRSRI
jgi:HSP20 family protein